MHSAQRNGLVLARFGYVRRVGVGHYKVSSPKNKTVRDVWRVGRRGMACSCHYNGKDGRCVHVHALRHYLTIERRKRAGKRIASTEGLVAEVAYCRYEVRSTPDSKRAYTVWIEDRWLSCNCPDHVTESNDCKHIYAVEEYGKSKHVKSGSILQPLLLRISCKLDWSPLLDTDFRDILFTLTAPLYIRYGTLRALPVLPSKLGGCQVP